MSTDIERLAARLEQLAQRAPIAASVTDDADNAVLVDDDGDVVRVVTGEALRARLGSMPPRERAFMKRLAGYLEGEVAVRERAAADALLQEVDPEGFLAQQRAELQRALAKVGRTRRPAVLEPEADDGASHFRNGLGECWCEQQVCPITPRRGGRPSHAGPPARGVRGAP